MGEYEYIKTDIHDQIASMIVDAESASNFDDAVAEAVEIATEHPPVSPARNIDTDALLQEPDFQEAVAEAGRTIPDEGLIEFAYEVAVINLDKGDYEKIAEVALQQL